MKLLPVRGGVSSSRARAACLEQAAREPLYSPLPVKLTKRGAHDEDPIEFVEDLGDLGCAVSARGMSLEELRDPGLERARCVLRAPWPAPLGAWVCAFLQRRSPDRDDRVVAEWEARLDELARNVVFRACHEGSYTARLGASPRWNDGAIRGARQL